jgi:CRP-like cAMP-binding protein
MFKQFGPGALEQFDQTGAAQSGALDALVALERIGSRRSYQRDEEIYAEGDISDSWFRVVAGTVRVCKLLPDGRRHIAEFFFAGECFGLDRGASGASQPKRSATSS